MSKVKISGPEADLGDIARHIDKEGLDPAYKVKQVMAEFAHLLPQILKETGRVEVYGLGVFQVVEYKPRMERNFQTGVSSMGPARKRVKFKPSKSFIWLFEE